MKAKLSSEARGRLSEVFQAALQARQRLTAAVYAGTFQEADERAAEASAAAGAFYEALYQLVDVELVPANRRTAGRRAHG